MNKCTNCGQEFEGNFCPNCGTQFYNQGTMRVINSQQPDLYRNQKGAISTFTGGAFSNAFRHWLANLVSIITLGLAYPAMKCWIMRWESEHTIIEGKHLTFDGKASQLFGKYLLWMLLSVITVGLYYIFAMQTNLIRWQTKHTHFEGENGESKFTGTALGYLGVRLLIIVISICTLFIGSFWASCYKNRWITSRKIIDGQQLLFNGKAMQYFGKRIVWLLLTLITIGIYSFWLKVKSKKWLTSHIKIATEEELQAELAMQDVNNYKAFCVLGLILAIIFRVIYMIVIIKMFNSIDDDTETFIPILSTIGFSLRCTIIPLIVNIIAVSMGSKRAKNGRSVKGKGFAIAGIIIAIL